MSAVAAGRSVWAKSFSVVLRSRLSLAGVVLVLGLVSVAVFAPILAAYDPILIDLPKRDHAPDWSHPLGTDTFGRDILSRILWGTRLSLLLGLGSVAIGSAGGVLLGLISGYTSGWFDAALMRVVDVFIAFRLLLLAIMVMAILGPGLANTVIAIGVSLFAEFARLTRGEVLGTKEREFVEAARATGAGALRITVLHILPNIANTLIALCRFQKVEGCVTPGPVPPVRADEQRCIPMNLTGASCVTAGSDVALALAHHRRRYFGNSERATCIAVCAASSSDERHRVSFGRSPETTLARN